MMKTTNKIWWSLWLLATLVVGSFYAYALMGAGDKSLYLPGQTSHGHYQIEMACDSCHGGPFEGEEAIQKACVSCHSAELKKVEDSHPKSKFTNPRNADRVAILDARYCVTCHSEHNPEITREMGVTLAEDFCYLCHDDVAKNRPSHEGMEFDTCASAGCHNYHDNKALYEDFLVKHGNEPDTEKTALNKERNFGSVYRLQSQEPVISLTRNDADLPEKLEPEILHEWGTTAHAEAGVNCSGCHGTEKEWVAQPSVEQCKECHSKESDGFLAGRHGMRVAQELSPMTPAQARLPMQEDNLNHQLGCSSCHGGHQFDTQKAAVESCLTCHNDEHSRAYKESSHFKLWRAELEGTAEQGSGVSCATCHMPREIHKLSGEQVVLVQHNQNMNLRPNEKMIRGVCMECHGLGFSINSLADEELIRKGFNGRPSVEIESVEMALNREKES